METLTTAEVFYALGSVAAIIFLAVVIVVAWQISKLNRRAQEVQTRLEGIKSSKVWLAPIVPVLMRTLMKKNIFARVAGLAAASALAYILLGDKEKRERTRDWALKTKNDVMSRLDKIETKLKKRLPEIVDDITNKEKDEDY